MDGKFVTVGPGSRLLNVSATTLCKWARQGQVRYRLVDGQRQFEVADLLRLKAERAEKQRALVGDRELEALAV